MKKSVLSASIALACCSFATVGFAAQTGPAANARASQTGIDSTELEISGSTNDIDWNLGVGALLDSTVAYSSLDYDTTSEADLDGFDGRLDGQVSFNFNLTADNGLTFGARVELEGFNQSNSDDDQDHLNEAFLFVKGNWGEVLIGDTYDAGRKLSETAPDVAFIGIEQNNFHDLVPYGGSVSDGIGSFDVGNDVRFGTLGDTLISNGASEPTGKISYFSPNLAGFIIGASYGRDDEQFDDGQINCADNVCEFFDIALNYVHSFGSFDLAASARYGTSTRDVPDTAPAGANRDDPEVYGFGLNLGFGGFTIGGSFADQSGTWEADGDAYDLGVSYEVDGLGLSLTYFNGENIDDENFSATPSPGFSNPKEEVEIIKIATNYDLGNGISWYGMAADVQFDEEVGDFNATGDDIDGFVIGTGFRLSF